MGWNRGFLLPCRWCNLLWNTHMMAVKSYRAFLMQKDNWLGGKTMFKNKSEMISKRLRRSFRSTDCKVANCRCYGYDTTPGCKLVINQTEVKIVCWIFECYLIGYSLGKISASLEKQDVLSPTGRAKWGRETISKLLFNEKYTGLALLQKTMSFASAQFKNDGELDQVLLKIHHEAIISTANFEKVQ